MARRKSDANLKPDTAGIFDPGRDNVATVKSLYKLNFNPRHIAKATGLADGEVNKIIARIKDEEARTR